MASGGPMRMVVIGASGSGKSTVAQRIGAAHALPVHDLDAAYWSSARRARATGEARAIVAEAAAGAGWVIEGVWAELLEVALARATVLVWLDLSWDACLEGMIERGPHFGFDPTDPDDRLALANAHQERSEGQARAYAGFGGQRIRLRTRGEVASFSVDGQAAAR